jgi:hypothetical protein
MPDVTSMSNHADGLIVLPLILPCEPCKFLRCEHSPLISRVLMFCSDSSFKNIENIFLSLKNNIHALVPVYFKTF